MHRPSDRLLVCPVAAALLGLAAPALATPPAGQGYKLLWADEFSGSTLDQMKWSYNYSWGHTHNHAAYMDQSQVLLGGGVLDLQAIHVRNPNAKDFTDPTFGYQKMDYTSGAINSAGKFTASTGYFEASMKLPSAAGSWPAFWMLKDGWPPEIDVMEYPRGANNAANQYWANLHYTDAASPSPASYGWQTNIGSDLSSGYHTYGVEWTTSKMTFYVDGNALHTITDANAIADAQNMYLILNHGVGGWAGTPTATTPQDFLIDYVRVWQKPATSATTMTWSGTAASANWDSGTNWGGVAPTLQDQVAAFGTNPQAAVSTAWTNSRTVGGLSFDGATAYTIGNANGSLMLANSGGTAAVTVAATTTTPQNIASRVEAYSAVNVTNNSAQTLTISGVIVGDGSMTFEGAGTTVVSNNNTYTGDTYIDSGTQGPAVVRADRSRAFGTGTVWFNTAGNGTTGRLELTTNREQPNNINLSGRNNTSVAIENVSDNNKLSGTISALSGGGSYLIQSDAGQLELSGTATQANGIALTAAASGNRTFTLGGAGNGLVSGQIVNGVGTVGITKAGAGTWSFGANNTYTGTTTVSAGTLLVNGTQTGGAYVVSAGATLGGSGTIDPTAANAVTVAGTLAPGTGLATLAVGSAASPNDVVFSPGGTLAIELAAGGLSDRLAVSGGLNLTAGGDVLSLTTLAGALDGSTYTLATFTPGTLGAGRFDQLYLNGVPMADNATVGGSGYRVAYDDAAGQVQLVAVPEPAACGLLAVAGLGLLGRARRRA